MKVYYEQDADFNIIKDKKIVIIGFGSQGHAHALNLKDSGASNVVVGLREGSSSIEKAKNVGLKTQTPAEAVKDADIVMFLAPDENQQEIYQTQIHDNIKNGAALAFAFALSGASSAGRVLCAGGGFGKVRGSTIIGRAGAGAGVGAA